MAKQQKTDMHGKAVNMELQPTLEDQLYLDFHSAFASVTTDESNRVVKSFDAAYMHVSQGGNALHQGKIKIAMQLNRVANELRLCIAKLLCNF